MSVWQLASLAAVASRTPWALVSVSVKAASLGPHVASVIGPATRVVKLKLAAAHGVAMEP